MPKLDASDFENLLREETITVTKKKRNRPFATKRHQKVDMTDKEFEQIQDLPAIQEVEPVIPEEQNYVLDVQTTEQSVPEPEEVVAPAAPEPEEVLPTPAVTPEEVVPAVVPETPKTVGPPPSTEEEIMKYEEAITKLDNEKLNMLLLLIRMVDNGVMTKQEAIDKGEKIQPNFIRHEMKREFKVWPIDEKNIFNDNRGREWLYVINKMICDASGLIPFCEIKFKEYLFTNYNTLIDEATPLTVRLGMTRAFMRHCASHTRGKVTHDEATNALTLSHEFRHSVISLTVSGGLRDPIFTVTDEAGILELGGVDGKTQMDITTFIKTVATVSATIIYRRY